MVALLAISLGSARAALVHDIHEIERHAERGYAPRHPVLICNPWSGGGKVEQFGLVELAHELGVETIMLDHGLDLEQLARDAIASGADCLGMAGGDGSQALVASIAVEHDLPFVCVSAGTRNHFALDLGLDRRRSAQERRRVPRRGRASHRLRDGERPVLRQQRLARRLRDHRAAGGLPRGQDRRRRCRCSPRCWARPRSRSTCSSPSRTAPQIDGAFLIQVSNNPYVLGASLDVSQRRRMDTRPARRLRRHRGDGRGGSSGGHAVGARPTQPQQGLARVHRPRPSRSAPARARPTPASTARRSRWRRRCASRSIPAACACSCPRATSSRPSVAGPATSRLGDLVSVARGIDPVAGTTGTAD